MNDHDTGAGHSARQFTDDEQRAISGFAGFLTHSMLDAIQDRGMLWTDTIYAAGMAVRAISQMAVLVATADDGSKYTPEQAASIAEEVLQKALATQVELRQVGSVAELEALAALDEVADAPRRELH